MGLGERARGDSLPLAEQRRRCIPCLQISGLARGQALPCEPPVGITSFQLRASVEQELEHGQVQPAGGSPQRRHAAGPAETIQQPGQSVQVVTLESVEELRRHGGATVAHTSSSAKRISGVSLVISGIATL